MMNNSISIDEALRLAVTHHNEGRISDAEEIYHAILQIDPNHSDANYYLGLLAISIGCEEEGSCLLRRAIELNSSIEHYHLGYIDALVKAGKIDLASQAVEEAKKALHVTSQERVIPDEPKKSYKKKTKTKISHPTNSEVKDVGKLFSERDYSGTKIFAKRLVDQYPNSGIALNILGVAHRYMGESEDSMALLQRAVKLLPLDYAILYNLGVAYQDLHNHKKAIECFAKVIQMKPDYVDAYNNLSAVHLDQGDYDEAKGTLQKLLTIQPMYMRGHCNIGLVFKNEGNLNLAIKSFHKALELDATVPDVYNNLGNALIDIGNIDEAIENYQKSILLNPNFEEAYANLLFALNYHPDKSAEEIYESYKDYNTHICKMQTPKLSAYTNSTILNRKLKIGYVSPDLKMHPVRLFLEPLLANHDKTGFEVYAYAEISKEDSVTQRYKSYIDHWIPTLGMSDETLAQRIREDGIDILIDIAGHTAGNRLGTFTLKPAPVSVSWLGFGYTTGLTAMDYYLTDEISAPKGSERLFSEKLWRIQTPSYVFRPGDGMGEVGELPVLKRGYITFGTLSRSVRINHRTIRVWAEVLKRVPSSKLLIDSKNYTDTNMVNDLMEKFEKHGIEGHRLQFGYHSPPWDVLRNVDIGLDCFPHNSGTTLFEMLYMGIPYVTLADRPSVGRIGSAILHGIHKSEWISNSEDEYIDKLVALATNLSDLSAIRSNLRNEMIGSPLMDEKSFALKVEGAFRDMFTQWCETLE